MLRLRDTDRDHLTVGKSRYTFSFKGTKYTAGFIGTLPKPWTLEEIYERLAQYMPLDVNIISSSKEQTCIFVLCLNNNKDKVYEILRGMDFSHPSVSIDIPPAEQLKSIMRSR